MKAIVANQYGGIETLRVADMPKPSVGKGQVLIEVRATSLNPIDYKIRSGTFRYLHRPRFPLVLGVDVAGVVAEVGAGVHRFERGQAVFGVLPWTTPQGTHAEYTVAPDAALHPMPAGLDFESAAALPCAGLTALAGTKVLGELAGKRVLVNGATGGVGHFAVQIARARGAQVSAVCSEPNREFAQQLGADEVIDYRATDLAALGRRFDGVFDAFGHLPAGKAVRMTAKSGGYCTTWPSPGVFFQLVLCRMVGGPRVGLAAVKTSEALYAELCALVASGAVRPHVEQVFPLSEAIEAFRLLEGGKVRGKLVLRVGSTAAK